MYPASFISKNNKISSGTCCLNLPREHIQKCRESCPLERNMKKLIKTVTKGGQVFQNFSLHCKVVVSISFFTSMRKRILQKDPDKNIFEIFFLPALLKVFELLKCNEFETANYFTADIFFFCHCGQHGQWDYSKDCFLFYSPFSILVFKHRHAVFR